jgi:hypothetical protein
MAEAEIPFVSNEAGEPTAVIMLVNAHQSGASLM